MPRVVRYIALFLLALFFSVPSAKAQQFDIVGKKKRVYVPFKIVRSMVIVQLKINKMGPYNFILDTGVGVILITDPSLADSLNIENKRTIKIAGLGERENYEAIVAPLLNIEIQGQLFSQNVSGAILKHDFFGLSNYAGIPIHGLLGHDFFAKLAVKISFTDSLLVVSRPENMRIFRKAEKIPLTMEEDKPYITTAVTLTNGIQNTNKLLIDLGAGHSLSLENVDSLPKRSIRANLGVGLNGLIDGHMGRVSAINMGRYTIKDVISSFPADDRSLKTSVDRHGSIGIGLLKRFDIIFDYQNKVMYLRPNSNFKQPFEHDMSGISYHAGGKDYDHLIVEQVDEGSAADQMGVKPLDEIVAINFKPVSRLSLQQIDDMFKSRDGRTILLEIFREKRNQSLILTLKRRI